LGLLLVLIPGWLVLIPGWPVLARQPAACVDYRFPVYFRPGSSALAPNAATEIAMAARQFRRCRIASVTVVGVSAPRRGPDLTEVRLHAVADALAARGFRHPEPSIAGAIIAGRRAVMRDAAEVEIVMAR
jgi:outer membrane protein OmpA-like peptidoglycan-associated protein